MSATTQPLKPFKAQYTFVFAAHGLADAGRQQRDFLEMAKDLGFYPAGRFATALGGMPLAEVVPGSALAEELGHDANSVDPRDGASVLPTGVAIDAPSGGSRMALQAATTSGESK